MKHMKVIVFSLFIVGMFSVYYAQTMSEIETYPSFALETIEGDHEAVKNVALHGDYHSEDVYHPFYLTLNETKYMEQTSYIEGLNGFGQSDELKRLQREFPSYMRGKDDDLSMYTESDMYIVQAGMKWGTYRGEQSSGDAFELAVLHKELEKQVRFTIAVPEADQASFRMLETMYAVGEQLHLVTSHEHEKSDGGTTHELRIYTVQLDRGKISRMDVAHTWEVDLTSQESSVVPIENTYSIGSDQRMLLLKRVIHNEMELEDVLQIDEQKKGNIEYELLAYDFRTKGFETYSLPSAIRDGSEIVSYEDNSTLFVTQMVDGELQVIEWTLGEEGDMETTVVPVDRTSSSYVAALKDHNMYIYAQTHAHGQLIGELHILDVQTKEWIYKGDVTTDRPLHPNEEIMIQRIE